MVMKNVIGILLFMILFTPLLRGQDHEIEAKRKAETLSKIMHLESTKTENQEKFDVKYYGLDLNISPTTQTVSGTLTVIALVVGPSISQMQLNFLNTMTTQGVTMSGKPVTFMHKGDMITINLDRSYSNGKFVSVAVSYTGKPSRSGFGAFGFDSHGGQPMIWSLSEPYGAKNWWPCKDFPSDKADSVDIRVTVPSNLVVASNGTLREVTDNGETKTYWWHEGYPIATYLVSMAIHPYRTFSHYYKYSATDSMEVKYFVYPDHYDQVQATYAKTVNMIRIFSEMFGQYPFIKEKYGHAEFVWGGGMEHQTCTSLGGWSEGLIVHELSHQWWGDMITCRDFHHIWLNEGFATYCEALYFEKLYGSQYYHQYIGYNKYFGSGTIYVYDTTSTGIIFDGSRSYDKGSWVLHMLRHVVGDSTFFKILRTYYADVRYQHGSVTTEQFRDVCEQVSGVNLHPFFHQWIYEEYFPTYSYQWRSVKSDGKDIINLTIEQKQTNTVYQMPVDIGITTATGDTTIVVYDTLQTQNFQLTVNSQPTRVDLDRDDWILKKVQNPAGVGELPMMPTVYNLSQNYPNPFNPRTVIKYQIPDGDASRPVHVQLKVSDLLGRELMTLVDGISSAGSYSVEFDGSGLASGVYFYTLRVSEDKSPIFTETRRMVVMK
jgi:aminopeptidase N